MDKAHESLALPSFCTFKVKCVMSLKYAFDVACINKIEKHIRIDLSSMEETSKD